MADETGAPYISAHEFKKIASNASELLRFQHMITDLAANHACVREALKDVRDVFFSDEPVAPKGKPPRGWKKFSTPRS